MDNKVRVLVVDDSALMRKLLSTVLSEDPEIEVVGVAADPIIARERIRKLNPDVLTLDVEMPNMDGLTFLRKIMELRPMPVIMVSSFTQAGAETTLEALEIGAVDFIAKPVNDVAASLAAMAAELQAKVKAAAQTRVGARRKGSVVAHAPRRERAPLSREKIVVIGASTGGVEALKTVLMRLPSECPPILVAQHMPPRFTSAFAQRLDRECPMGVSEATHDEIIEPGHVYIAPGSHHLKLARNAGRYRSILTDEPPVSGHRPSVDVLFRSACAVGPSVVAAILTGMGKDGAAGMLDLRQAGAITIGQDEESSLIYGMPRAAFERGAVMQQCSLYHIADSILDACEATASKPNATHPHYSAEAS